MSLHSSRGQVGTPGGQPRPMRASMETDQSEDVFGLEPEDGARSQWNDEDGSPSSGIRQR